MHKHYYLFSLNWFDEVMVQLATHGDCHHCLPMSFIPVFDPIFTGFPLVFIHGILIHKQVRMIHIQRVVMDMIVVSKSPLEEITCYGSSYHSEPVRFITKDEEIKVKGIAFNIVLDCLNIMVLIARIENDTKCPIGVTINENMRILMVICQQATTREL